MEPFTLDEMANAIAEATGLMEPSRERLAAGIGIGCLKMLEAAPADLPVSELRETLENASKTLGMIAAEQGEEVPALELGEQTEKAQAIKAAAETIMGL